MEEYIKLLEEFIQLTKLMREYNAKKDWIAAKKVVDRRDFIEYEIQTLKEKLKR